MELDPIDTCAALTAQRMLLEQLYARAYADKPTEFSAFMADLIAKTQSTLRAPEPTEQELLTEIAVHTSAHLQRFGAATLQRIRQP